ncbi:bifunctional [glutamine synthetase] adenylyltransferase/[glutamine synthetase]-adenylyl-L-tyrosine phosphorylase [Devriesea agamarum]|uniref:bifunctional [glutamine synthetase] adenylyltransferase/[glutamine synthetase]-adenylyl-L-tyrosine phosphorylase n=1 Tax=Devriesea agamarum TaxID=472569 RepID=UPI000A787014|nr:bifunctional [glutamine synthetase] adenylyltransferase/[glutamine synthetase]-adenylyl-L-tyrosine phosphorylase [Devriesea agamarum]
MEQSTLSHGALARLGFSDTTRAQRFLADPLLATMSEASLRRLADSIDPDQALIALLRLAESANRTQTETTPQSSGAQSHRDPDYHKVFRALLRAENNAPEQDACIRMMRILGGSVALGDVLARHPSILMLLASDESPFEVSADDIRRDILTAVGADPDERIPVATLSGRQGCDALRIAYYRRLITIAAWDLSSDDPVAMQPSVSEALADLAGASLEAALAIARAQTPQHERVRLAILAMGKTGARELNYISDVDVLYVAAPAPASELCSPSDAVTETGPGQADAHSCGAEPSRTTSLSSQDSPLSSDDEVLEIAGALARQVARICSERTAEGALWQVDANLRPEGKDGPLVRTLDSYARYYRRWAESWEFQALLKARCVAGDRELGQGLEDLTRPMVWQASFREGFVEDTRAMRRRVVDHIPRREVDRNVKLGPGGLRDVEFTVQLLQMVHGRGDDTVRARGTLTALRQLCDGGYIARHHASELDESYRFLRTVEHRLQLARMRRTQVLPTAENDIRRLSRGVGLDQLDFLTAYDRIRRRVRHLHEEIFYRPLLLTASNLSDDQVRLSPQAARDRLAAIGYRDPAKAVQHIQSLTKGISRRAAIQRQLLPSFLEWFAEGIDPDLGLLSFRKLSDEIGSAHWYLALLRDSGSAARHLTRILSSSRFVAGQLEKIPDGVRWLARADDLVPLNREALQAEFTAVIRRLDTVDEAADLLRRTRNRELLRVAMAHLLGRLTPAQVAAALTDLAGAVLNAGVYVARYAVACEQIPDGHTGREDAMPADSDQTARHPGGNNGPGQQGPSADSPSEIDRGHNADGNTDTGSPSTNAINPSLGIEFAVLAMGSFGAGEMGYASDADVQFVIRDVGAGERTSALGIAVATQLQRLLNAPTYGADMKVSADLRPEGKNGVLARTFTSFTEYYEHHAEIWERQALLRATPIAGDSSLCEDLDPVLDSVRYPCGGLSKTDIRSIRRMKARVESERLPRGMSPQRHLKLGRGTMTDVEWVAQLIQMRHADQIPALRVTGTLHALRAAQEAGLISADDLTVLYEAWVTSWSLRRAHFLWKGRISDVLPTDRNDLLALARLLSGPDASAAGVEEDFLRVARHARTTVERLFFDETP